MFTILLAAAAATSTQAPDAKFNRSVAKRSWRRYRRARRLASLALSH